MQRIPVAKLLDAAGGLFDVAPEIIMTKSRKAPIFRARAAVALAARVAGYKYRQIAQELGRRQPTIMSACDRAEQFYRENARFKCHCDSLFEMARQFREAENDNWDSPERAYCEVRY